MRQIRNTRRTPQTPGSPLDPITFRVGINEDEMDWVLPVEPFENFTQTALSWADFTQTGPIPEPGTAALLGLGLAGLAIRGRSRH